MCGEVLQIPEAGTIRDSQPASNTFMIQFLNSETGMFRLSQKIRLCLQLVAMMSTTLSSFACGDLPRIVVSSVGDGFVFEGTDQPVTIMGFNYDHDETGRLIEDYWHEEWDRIAEDFAQMKVLGANVVRVHLQFGRFMESPDQPRAIELVQLKKLLALAEEQQLYLDITGLGCYHKNAVPAWYDRLDEQARWKAQERFWEHVATTCKDSSAVFCFNLMNEPVIGGEQPAGDWLGPEFAGKHFVQFVARQTNGRKRHDIARQWIEQMTAAVRRHAPRPLITVGFVDWSLDRPGLTSGFIPDRVSERLDFLAVHIYPDSQKSDLAMDTLNAFQIGKPVVVEETFPLKCSNEALENFMTEAGSLADGWISFFWGRMPDEYSETTSIGDAITAGWLRRFSIRMQQSVANSPHARVSDDAVLKSVVQHVRAHPDGMAPNSVNLSAWDADTRKLPIGVFDSGIGGLTVLEAILQADNFDNASLRPDPDGIPDFQNEKFIYMGDQANMPYGNYPAVQQTDYLRELILKDAIFLLGNRFWPSQKAAMPSQTKPTVKAIVIACNTATAFGINDIRHTLAECGIPVFVLGVVDAGARGLLEQPTSPHQQTVAVMATVGTCSSNAYPKAIARILGQAGRRVPEIVQQGSRGLAGAIEGDPAFVTTSARSAAEYAGPSLEQRESGINTDLLATYDFDPSGLIGQGGTTNGFQLNSVSNYIRFDIVTLLESYRKTGKAAPIATVVLGCTHFPLVRNEIAAEFKRLKALQVDGEQPYHALIADEVEIVDPAALLARELFLELALRRNFAVPGNSSAATVDDSKPEQMFLSVPATEWPGIQLTPDGALDHGYKYGRKAGRLDQEDTRVVPMTAESLPKSSKSLIRTRLPKVTERLGLNTP